MWKLWFECILVSGHTNAHLSTNLPIDTEWDVGRGNANVWLNKAKRKDNKFTGLLRAPILMYTELENYTYDTIELRPPLETVFDFTGRLKYRTKLILCCQLASNQYYQRR